MTGDHIFKTPKRNPDRVDFQVHNRGVNVIKYWRIDGVDSCDPNGCSTKPAESYQHAQWGFFAMVGWCEDNGYTVVKWPGGARAFKGEPWPIRSRAKIKKKRAQIERAARSGSLPDWFYFQGLDFAHAM